MTRQETINELAVVMHEDTGRSIPDIARVLETMTTTELEAALKEHQEQLASKLAELNDLQEKRIQANAEHAAAREMLLLQQRQNYQADQEAEARIAFPGICRELRISECDTNFRLIFDSFSGSLLSIEDIKSRIASGQLSFIPATDEEQRQWLDQELTALAEFVVDGLRGHQIGRYVTSRPLFETFDAVNRKQHIQWMKNLGLARLNDIKAQIEYNRRVKQQAGIRTPAPIQGSMYLPLPEFNEDGTKIDSAYLLRLSRADKDSQSWVLFRQLCRKHGVDNLTARIQGRG
jgi:hypothetical protein